LAGAPSAPPPRWSSHAATSERKRSSSACFQLGLELGVRVRVRVRVTLTLITLTLTLTLTQQPGLEVLPLEEDAVCEEAVLQRAEPRELQLLERL